MVICANFTSGVESQRYGRSKIDYLTTVWYLKSFGFLFITITSAHMALHFTLSETDSFYDSF